MRNEATSSSGENRTEFSINDAERPRRRGSWFWRMGVIVVGGTVVIFFLLRPDPDSIEAKVNKILEETRREERNQTGIYALAEELYQLPEPLPKLGQWIRDEGPDREWVDVEGELLSLGDEAGPAVLRLLADDPSAAVRRELCQVAIQFGGIDPLPVLTNLLASDPSEQVRGAAATAAVEFDADRAAPALLTAVKGEKDYFASSSIIEALPKIGAARALEPLVSIAHTLLAADTAFQRDNAVRALSELGEAAIGALREILNKQLDSDLTSAAALGLAKVKDLQSLPRVIEMLEMQVKATTEASTNGASQGITAASPASREFDGFAERHGVYELPMGISSDFVVALGEFESPTAVPVLLRALDVTKENYVKQSIVEALGKIGDERALEPILLSVGQVQDQWTLRGAITSIAQIKSPNTPAVLLNIMTNHTQNAGDVVEALSQLQGEVINTTLRELLKNSTGRVREAVAHALGMSGDADALPVLLEAIDSGNDEARKAAAEGLGMIADPKAVPALIVAMNDSSSDVRQEVAWALGYIADPAAAPALIKGLSDTDFGVKFASAFALAGIQSSEAVEPLKQLLTDKERRVQIAAACSLCFHDSDAGMKMLSMSLKSRGEDWHRFAAIVGLLRLNSQEARSVLEQVPNDIKSPAFQRLREAGLSSGIAGALVELLRTGDKEQRHYAARVLPYFREASTIPALRDASSDDDVQVRSAARVAAVQLERQLAARQTSAP